MLADVKIVMGGSDNDKVVVLAVTTSVQIFVYSPDAGKWLKYPPLPTEEV